MSERLNKLNNNSVTVILDWYHLYKKIREFREFLSMIAGNQTERINHSKFLFFHLWHGNYFFIFPLIEQNAIS